MSKYAKQKKYLIIILAGIFAANFFGATWMALMKRIRIQNEEKRLKQSEQAGPLVEATQVKTSTSKKQILLVGEARAFYTVTLYARVSGYLTHLYADIGKKVKKNEILARVESPEAEQAYESALADALNKKHIAQRNRALVKRRLISQQEADQAIAASEIAQANLATQKTIRDYQNISAPFDGVVTQRFVDPGSLIQNASASQAASQPLFTVSQINQLRMFVYVDQKNAPYIRVGDSVDVKVPANPEVKFTAKVAQIAGELDPKTRTLLVEIHIDNEKNRIIAGSFVQVFLNVNTPSYMQLPAQALVLRGGNPFVVELSPNNEVHYAQVDLVENDGTRLLIRSGIKEGQKVILNAGNNFEEGSKVRPVLEKQHQQAGQGRS